MTFITGVTVGALFGVLYAPDKGQNVRRKLSYQLDKYRETLKELMDEIMDGKIESVSNAKSKGKKVISDAVDKAQKLMEEVDALKEQIMPSNDNQS